MRSALALCAIGLTATVVAAVSHASGSDPPTILEWHQVGGIGIGMTEARVEYEYGTPHFGTLGTYYTLHGGQVSVSYDKSHNVSSIMVTGTSYYRAADGFGVGYHIPLGSCHRSGGSCTYRWKQFTYSSGDWYGNLAWKGSELSVLIMVQQGAVQSFSLYKLGIAGHGTVVPSAATVNAIRRTVHDDYTKNCVGGANASCGSHLTVSGVRLSKTNQSYASAFAQPRGGQGYAALLHHTGGVWKVISSGTADVGCSTHTPQQVLADLSFYCR